MTKIDHKRRARGLAYDTQKRIDALVQRRASSQPTTGTKASENKQRAKAVKDLDRQISILRNRKIGLNNAG